MIFRRKQKAAPDGERIWNEQLPDDIPVVEGRRLLVLD